MSHPGDITALLQQWSEGEDAALDPLFELVYPQLRSIAASLMQRERRGNMLQPTGLVNEFYLKLMKQERLRFEDRAHFLSLAARFMRRILVDQVRKSGRRKRDGGQPVTLTDDLLWISAAGPELIDIGNALDELQKIDDRKCKIVELRYFLGFTSQETAGLLEVSKNTIDRELKFARGWIQDRLWAQSE